MALFLAEVSAVRFGGKQMCHAPLNRCSYFLSWRTTMVVWLVADCGLLSYQIIENYKRMVTLQISTNTAINYTMGYVPLFIDYQTFKN